MKGFFGGIFCGIKLLIMNDREFTSISSSGFRWWWLGLLLLSGLWGGLLASLWYGLFWLTKWSDSADSLVGLLLAAVHLLCIYRYAAISLVRIIGGRNRTLQTMLMSFLVLAFIICLMLLRSDWHRHEAQWPAWADLFRPASKVVRVTILSCLWGGWSMMILPNFYRRSVNEQSLVACMGRWCGPVTCVLVMGGLLGLSIGWFGYMAWTQLSISVCTLVAATIGGFVLAHIHQVLDRKVLLASNILTQIVFLIIFHLNRNIDL